MTLAVMGCVVNGPGESKAASIGISLPGTGEAPNCPVYIDGQHFTTLRGTYEELYIGLPRARGRLRLDQIPAKALRDCERIAAVSRSGLPASRSCSRGRAPSLRRLIRAPRASAESPGPRPNHLSPETWSPELQAAF